MNILLNKYTLTGVVALLLFGAGYFTAKRTMAPQIKIQEKEVIKIDKQIETEIVEVIKPDGTKTTTTQIKEITKTVIEKVTKKEIDNRKWLLSIGKQLDKDYMITINYKVTNNIHVGVFGDTNKQLGLTIGYSF